MSKFTIFKTKADDEYQFAELIISILIGKILKSKLISNYRFPNFFCDFDKVQHENLIKF